MNRRRAATVMSAMLLLATATTAALRAGQAADEPKSIVSNDGTYRVTYERPSGEAAPLNERFLLTVNVQRRDSVEPAADVELAVDASMPEHMHGMNVRPTVTRNVDGSFTVDGILLHMPGRWELYFDIKWRGVTERAQVELFLE